METSGSSPSGVSIKSNSEYPNLEAVKTKLGRGNYTSNISKNASKQQSLHLGCVPIIQVREESLAYEVQNW